MKFKIVNSPRYTPAQLQETVRLVYLTYLLAPQRKSSSERSWLKIKTDKNYFYTVDSLFCILNDGCLLDSERIAFLTLLQNNALLRQNFLQILQREEIENSWDDLKNILSPNHNQLDFNLLENVSSALSRERKLATDNFRNQFLDTTFFNLVLSHCSSLIEELNDASLSNLLLQNPAATTLLTKKNFAKRFAKILQLENLKDLFLLGVSEDKKKDLTLTLLNYCHEYQPGIFIVILRSVFATHNDPKEKQEFFYIKERLFCCKEKLLSLLDEHPKYFNAVVDSMATCKEIIALSSDQVAFLTMVVKKDKQISHWVGQNLLAICAFLLSKTTETRNQQVTQFISKNSDLKISYQSLLCSAVRRELTAIEAWDKPAQETSKIIAVRNEVFVLVQNPSIRCLLKFTANEIDKYLRVSSLRTLFDRIVAEDEVLWLLFLTDIKEKLIKEDSEFSYNYPCLNARLTISKKLRCFDLTDFYSSTLQGMEALIATNTDWPQVKKNLLPKNFTEGLPIHFFMKLRNDYDIRKPVISFSEEIVNYLLSPVALAVIVKNSAYLDMLCLLGSGEQIITFFRSLVNFCKTTKELLSAARHTHRVLTRKIANDFYLLNKVAGATTVENILDLIDLFNEKEIRPYLNSEIFVLALLFQDPKERRQKLKSTSERSDLALKFIDASVVSRFRESFECLLTDPENVAILLDQLFQKLTVDLVSRLIPLLPFILKTESCLLIKNKLIDYLLNNFSKIVNPEFINFLFDNQEFLKIISRQVSADQFAFFLSSLTVSTSPAISQHIFINIQLFPINNLLKNKAALIMAISKNKYFADYIFQKWSLLTEMILLPEELVQMLFSNENKDTYDFLLSRENINFLAILNNILTAVSPSLRETVERKSPLLKRVSSEVEQKWESSKGERVAQAIIHHRMKAQLITPASPVAKLRELDGNTEEVVQAVRESLSKNLVEGIHDLMSNLESAAITPKIYNIPMQLFLCDEFFSDVRLFIDSFHYDKIYIFLMSLPRHFFSGFAEFFNLKEEVDQVCLIKLIYRIKVLATQYIVWLATNWERHKSKRAADFLVNILFLLSENFPNDVLQLLENQTLYNLVLNILNREKLSSVKTVGEFILRLLLLKIGLTNENKSENQLNQLNALIHDLVLVPLFASGDHFVFVHKLFTAQELIKINNKYLTSFFLRHPFYCQYFSQQDLLSLMESSPELMNCIFLYPHNYLRLGKGELEDLIKKANLKKEDLLAQFSDNILTAPIAALHPCFAQEGLEFKQQTARLDKLLKKLLGSEEAKSINSDQELLIACLYTNKHLPFLATPEGKLVVATLKKYNPYMSSFEAIANLVVTMVESSLFPIENQREYLASLCRLEPGTKEIMREHLEKLRINYNADAVNLAILDWVQKHIRLLANSYEGVTTPINLSP